MCCGIIYCFNIVLQQWVAACNSQCKNNAQNLKCTEENEFDECMEWLPSNKVCNKIVLWTIGKASKKIKGCTDLKICINL